MGDRYHEYITWERVTLGVVSLLVMLLGLLGTQVNSELHMWRDAVVNLNNTLSELRVEIAVNKNRYDALDKRIEDTRNWVDKVSTRLHVLEGKK